MAERSSRTLSHMQGVVCGRDEETQIFREVFSYQRDNEPEREVTMQCIDYVLTTRGGELASTGLHILCGADKRPQQTASDFPAIPTRRSASR